MPASDSKSQALRAAFLVLVFFLAAAIPFWNCFLSPDFTLLYRDAGNNFLAQKSLWANSVRTGQGIPLWNYFVLGGTPYLANSSDGPLSPLNLVFLAFAPENYPRAVLYFVYFHYVIFLGGAYLLARHFRLPRIDSLGFGIALALSGTAVSAHVLSAMLGSFVLLPWFWLFLLRARGAANNIRALLPLAISLALAIYMGDPHIAASMGLATALVLLTNRRVRLRDRIVGLSLAGLLSLLLAAPQLWPLLESARIGGRIHNGLPEFAALAWSLDLRRWPELLFPNPFGTLFPFLEYSGPLPEHVGNTNYFLSLYLGPHAFFLLLCAPFLLRRRPRLLIWLASAFVFLLYSCGKYAPLPLFSWVREVMPFFDAVRYPERFYVWPYFLFGISFLLSYRRLTLWLYLSRSRWRFLPSAAAAVAFATSLVLSLACGRYVLAKALQLFALWHLLLACFLAAYAFGRIRRASFSGLFLVLLALGTCAQSIYWVWPAPKSLVASSSYSHVEEMRLDLAKRETELKRGAARRIATVLLPPKKAKMLSHSYMQAWSDLPVLRVWEGLLENTPAYFGLETVQGSTDFFLPDGRDVLFDNAMEKDHVKILDLFGVFYTPKRTDHGVELERRSSALPYLFFPPRVAFRNSQRDTIFTLLSDEYNAHELAIVEKNEPGSGGALADSSQPFSSPLPELEILTRSGHEMRIALRGPRTESRWLIWNESYFPSWHARLGAQELPVYRANAWAMAVEIPAGSDATLSFEFRSASLRGGLFLFLLGLATALALYRRKHMFL